MSKAKQKERVLNALKVKSVSPWYAAIELGNLRLAATIHELKKDGHEISSVTEVGKNKFGETISYSRYTLVKEKTDE